MRVGHIATFNHPPCWVIEHTTTPYVSSFSEVCPYLGACRWYSSLSMAAYSFCSFSISSNFLIMHWSVFSSSSIFDPYNCAFDPLVVSEPLAPSLPTLAMGTSSLGITVFPELASLGTPCSYLGISTLALDGSLTSAGLSKSLNVSFSLLISF